MLTLSRLRELQFSIPAPRGGGFHSAYDGIKILKEYSGVTASTLVNGNIIFLANADSCIINGLTEPDAARLFELGWMLNDYDNFFYEL